MCIRIVIQQMKRERLVKWLFDLIRSRGNAVPIHTWSDDIFSKIVSSLCDLDTYLIYQDGSYSLNNIGANILTQFFPEILDVVKGGKVSHRDFFKEDKRLIGYCRTFLKYCTSPLEMFKMMSFRGSSRCYNFRPATAKALYEVYGKDNCKVLDTSSGFGGRLLGFFTAKNTYDLWVDGFYRNTIYNSCNALKIDGTFAINISWLDNIKEYTEEFLNDCGFYIIKEDKYLLRIHPRESSYGSDKMSKYEPIWVAKHYTELLKEGMITREKAEECYNRVKVGNKRIL